MESVRPVSKLSTESVGSRRELVANCVHTADADATKQFLRVGVGGVYWASHKAADVNGTAGTDVQIAEAEVISDVQLHNDVSGRLEVGAVARQADRSTCRHGARILTTHVVLS